MIYDAKEKMNTMATNRVMRGIIIHNTITTIAIIFMIFVSVPAYSENSTCEETCLRNCNKDKYPKLIKSARLGDRDAQYQLGMLYIEDDNYAEAIQWLQKAALNNHGEASFQLYSYYIDPPNQRNIEEAKKWLYKASENGYRLADVVLGNFYFYGLYSSTRDYKNAIHHYTLAANAGEKKAIIQLGIMYAEGLGVKRNFAESVRWLRLGQENGNQYNEDLLNRAIRKENIYKNIIIKPLGRLKEVSFIEYVIALLLALIGIRLTVKYNREKMPSYCLRGFNLIAGFSSNIELLEITYDKKKIDNLTISNLIFWNAGKETINRDDIVTSDPLRLVLSRGNFLDAKIIYSNNQSNQFSFEISEDKAVVYLGFNYLDKNDGIILQLAHTNVSTEEIKLVGLIKGAGQPKRKIFSEYMSSTKNYVLKLIPPILLVIVSLFFYLQLSLYSSIEYDSSNTFSNFINLLISAVLILYIVAITIIYFKNRFPKGYKLFIENSIHLKQMRN